MPFFLITTPCSLANVGLSHFYRKHGRKYIVQFTFLIIMYIIYSIKFSQLMGGVEVGLLPLIIVYTFLSLQWGNHNLSDRLSNHFIAELLWNFKFCMNSYFSIQGLTSVNLSLYYMCFIWVTCMSMGGPACLSGTAPDLGLVFVGAFFT